MRVFSREKGLHFLKLLLNQQSINNYARTENRDCPHTAWKAKYLLQTLQSP